MLTRPAAKNRVKKKEITPPFSKSTVFSSKITESRFRDQLEQQGVPHEFFLGIVKKLGTDQKTFNQTFGIHDRNIQRQRGKNLSYEYSIKTIRAMRIFAEAVKVLGTEEVACQWLKSSNPSLGEVIPMTLLVTQGGEEIVLDTLKRIEWGVYA